MKKNTKKADKNKYNNVVIKKDDLMPTTIGEIINDDHSLRSVILLFSLLIIIILGLPYVTTIFQNIKDGKPPLSVTPTPTTPEPDETPSEPETPPVIDEDETEPEYYALDLPVDIEVDGLHFQLTLNSQNQVLSAVLTNESADSNVLLENTYYLELYNEEKKLLDRILVQGKQITSNLRFDYDIQEAYSLGVVKYVVISKKTESDYPNVTLKTNDKNQPYLTCAKNNEVLTYLFKKSDNTYLLQSINERIIYESPTEEEILTFEQRMDDYNSITGVDSQIELETTGFSIDTTIDLTKVSIKNQQATLNNEAYYEKDTEAKAIAFELNSSGYTCE